MAAEGTSVKRAILIIVLMLALPVGVAAQSAPNLQVLFTRVSDSSPVAGGRFTLRVRVINWGDWPAAATTLRYYRSTNAAISSADTHVGTGRVGALGSRKTRWESIDVTAPSTAGTYYYGACVDAVAGESDTTDNCSRQSATVEVVAVGVAAQSAPDLQVVSPQVSDSSPVEGGRFTLRVRVINWGDWPAAATTLRYYRSTNAAISSADTHVGTGRVGALGSRKIRRESIDLTAPSTAGTYYYGACVDAVAGESDTTDNCSRQSATVEVVAVGGGGRHKLRLDIHGQPENSLERGMHRNPVLLAAPVRQPRPRFRAKAPPRYPRPAQ